MVAQKLDGTAAAAAIKRELADRVAELAARGIMPGLATVLVGEDPGSQWYVAGKHRDCAEVGIASIKRELPESVTQDELEAVLAELNADPACTGYIVQLPLPKHIDTDRILECIDPAKDADGLHPTNLGRLVLNANSPIDSPLPCTPRGVIELVERNGLSWAGKHVVVVGRGVTVGRPIGPLLTRREYNATVTLTHTGTEDLGAELRRADVIVAAAGVEGIVRAEDVKPGAIVLDVGVSRKVDPETGKSRVVGDVDPGVAEVAGYISPNPGGVGPMTRALLLKNVVEMAERHSMIRAAAVLAQTEYEGFIGWVLDLMETLGEIGVGLAVLIETFVPPIPSEAVLPGAGFLAYEGRMSFWLAWLAATMGALIGAWAWYWIGFVFGRARTRWVVGKIPLMEHEDFDRAEAFFQKWGAAAVFFGRCVPLVRSFISIPAGIERMPVLKFSFYTFAGSGLWNGIWIGLGYAFGPAIKPVLEQWSGVISDAVLVVIAGLVVWFIVSRLLRNARRKSEAAAAGDLADPASGAAGSDENL